MPSPVDTNSSITYTPPGSDEHTSSRSMKDNIFVKAPANVAVKWIARDVGAPATPPAAAHDTDSGRDAPNRFKKATRTEPDAETWEQVLESFRDRTHAEARPRSEVKAEKSQTNRVVIDSTSGPDDQDTYLKKRGQTLLKLQKDNITLEGKPQHIQPQMDNKRSDKPYYVLGPWPQSSPTKQAKNDSETEAKVKNLDASTWKSWTSRLPGAVSTNEEANSGFKYARIRTYSPYETAVMGTAPQDPFQNKDPEYQNEFVKFLVEQAKLHPVDSYHSRPTPADQPAMDASCGCGHEDCGDCGPMPGLEPNNPVCHGGWSACGDCARCKCVCRGWGCELCIVLEEEPEEKQSCDDGRCGRENCERCAAVRLIFSAPDIVFMPPVCKVPKTTAPLKDTLPPIEVLNQPPPDSNAEAAPAQRQFRKANDYPDGYDRWDRYCPTQGFDEQEEPKTASGWDNGNAGAGKENGGDEQHSVQVCVICKRRFHFGPPLTCKDNCPACGLSLDRSCNGCMNDADVERFARVRNGWIASQLPTIEQALRVLQLSTPVSLHTVNKRLRELMEDHPSCATEYAEAYAVVLNSKPGVDGPIISDCGDMRGGNKDDGGNEEIGVRLGGAGMDAEDIEASSYDCAANCYCDLCLGERVQEDIGDDDLPAPGMGAPLDEQEPALHGDNHQRDATQPEQDPPTPKPLTVTYWATVESGNHIIHIPLDATHVCGPEKKIVNTGMQKVWKWVQEKGLEDKVGLQNAFDLATEMQKEGVKHEETEEVQGKKVKDENVKAAAAYFNPFRIASPPPFRWGDLEVPRSRAGTESTWGSDGGWRA
ncbi:hypothetical protein BU26DRAFT_521393 [Trematosphaeria pertusa]|uniref:Uncharacterized protein n=1 Tax=Trematosphaeria pertusa TaxID=390896 RepID=A0A6A6I659_9PLEO|nr:uncharacterized protein BU26DRAFT_521393 [Trematosphaeria pertusa]KAF2245841.1 hypothetical protein BU26DRAFT_521393 [Trematosphaeria pertusa]